MFELFFALSVLTLGAFILVAIRQRHKLHTFFTPYRVSMLGIFVAALLFFVPYYISFFRGESPTELYTKTALLSAHHAIRLFFVGAEYGEIYEFAMGRGVVGAAYSLYASFLFVATPLMTFGFILSMFEGVYARLRILFSRWSDMYLFSCMNEQSLCLAEGIREKETRAKILIANVSKDQQPSNMLDKAKKLDCICFSKKILEVEAELPGKIKSITCLLFDQDEANNVDDALHLIQSETKTEKEIYVLSTQDNYLFDDLPTPEHVHVFRVAHGHSLAMRTVESLGTSLFDNAVEKADGEKHISALILGLGAYGTEMTKALSWFTQAEGYRTTIHCLDMDPLAMEKFAHLHPGYFFGAEFMERDGILSGYPKCDIRIHSGVTMGTVMADRIILEDPDIRYVFVALGDDDTNISAAYQLRTLFARQRFHPMIHAVLKDNSKHALLQERGLGNLSFIGATAQLYSYDAIFQTEMKEKVVEENTRWVSREEAERMAFSSSNYRGNESYLIHRKNMERLGIPEILRPRCEHRRWIQYMCSEGYQYDPFRDQPRNRRDHLAKLSKYLVPFDMLEEDQKHFY